MKLFILIILGIIVVSFIAVLPLFQPGFFPIHDNTQVTRVSEMATAMKDGMIPVRWVPNLGYGFGYPIYTFYAPLAYYVGGLFVLLGLPALSATKLMIGIGMVLAGVTMYILARHLMRRDAAALAAILYMFAPYHGVNLYVRGAVAELWAYAFIPLAFYGLLRVFRDPTWGAVVIGAVGLAGVILSHNLTAYMLAPFYGVVFLYLLYHSFKKRNRLTMSLLLTTVGLGLMLSAFYWLPALAEMQYTNVDSQITGGSQYKDHFVCPEQLWAGVRGFAGSAPGCLDGLSFQIGKIHLLLAAFAVFIAAVFFKRSSLIWLLISGGLVAIFMLLPVSKFVWDLLPRIAYVQFPWRYLSFASFFLSLAGAAGLSLLFDRFLKKKSLFPWIFVVVIGVISIFFYSRFFQPQLIQTDLPDMTNTSYIRWNVSKISDEYLSPDFRKPKRPADAAVTLLSGEGVQVTALQEQTQRFRATVTATQEAELRVHKAVFPAWHFRLNGANVTPTQRNGSYVLRIPEGESEITGLYLETPVERGGSILTIIGIILSVIGIILWGQYYKNKHKTS